MVLAYIDIIQMETVLFTLFVISTSIGILIIIPTLITHIPTSTFIICIPTPITHIASSSAYIHTPISIDVLTLIEHLF